MSGWCSRASEKETQGKWANSRLIFRQRVCGQKGCVSTHLGESSLAIHVIDSNKAATFVWHSLILSPGLGPLR